ncbi:MAG TPA: MFS transporter [Trebonia sp.]|jgi:MFS family permease|nr:MFS transporter [Trebonia sp.]
MIGLLYRVYAMTGSTLASAITLLANLVPQVLLGTVAGVFVDRWDRKRTMITADLLLAAGLLPLLAVHGGAQLWIVCAVVAWEAAVEQLFTPAQLALVPALVSDEHLVAANALNGQVGSIARLAGSGLGGLIAAVGGLAAVTLTDAASFIASAALLVFVHARSAASDPAGDRAGDRAGDPAGDRAGDRAGNPAGASRLRALAAELKDGLRLAASHPLLRALLVFGLVTSIGENIMATLFAPFIREVLHGSNTDYGLVLAAQAIGGIAGGLLAAPLAQRFSATRLFTVSTVVFGAIDLGIFLYPLEYRALWPAFAGMIIVGLPGALSMAGLITLFQRATASAYRGRIFGAMGAVSSVGSLAGPLTAGYLSGTLGIVPVIAEQGAGYVVCGLLMMAALRSADATTGADGANGTPEIAKDRLISYN